MNYQETRSALLEQNLDIFSTQQFVSLFGITSEFAAVKLARYKKKGYLKSPKKRVYYLADIVINKFRLANLIYYPSYVSLDTVLASEGIMPEAIYPITSVTTKATREFDDGENMYTYSKIKTVAFGGYQKRDNALVATPEKAMVDYLYFVCLGKREYNDRLNISKLDSVKIFEFARQYGEARLISLTRKIWP